MIPICLTAAGTSNFQKKRKNNLLFYCDFVISCDDDDDEGTAGFHSLQQTLSERVQLLGSQVVIPTMTSLMSHSLLATCWSVALSRRT